MTPEYRAKKRGHHLFCALLSFALPQERKKLKRGGGEDVSACGSEDYWSQSGPGMGGHGDGGAIAETLTPGRVVVDQDDQLVSVSMASMLYFHGFFVCGTQIRR